MTYFDERLREVAGYFAAGDVHLGYRRLLDAAIETGNFAVYEETLKFCDWYDTVTDTTNRVELTANVNALLQVMANGYSGREQQMDMARLSADNVTKRYAHGKFSLSPTDVQLRPAEIIGLVGENGNGKTTLLRLLHGELLPDGGSIHYQVGQTGSSFYDVKTALAFIPQRPQQWYGGLMENLQFASTFTGYKGKENWLWTEIIVARMGLRQYRTYNWSRISSGYKMRFELARTLIRKPQILLLDEPLANLDMLAQQIILEDLRYLARSHSAPLSIILSSQQLYEVEKVSDQVIFLQKGVPRYQHNRATATATVATAPVGLTAELETTASREALQALFEPHGLQKLSFNGGVYLMYFGADMPFATVLRLLGEAGLPIKYIRDISASSRRFFDA